MIKRDLDEYSLYKLQINTFPWGLLFLCLQCNDDTVSFALAAYLKFSLS